jgi:acyl-CoA synthetase (AMP-forming)/AMP-acid ligase II
MSTDPGEKTDATEESDLPTAEQLLRRRAIQKPNVLALFDPPNRAALDLGNPSAFTYQEADLTADTLAAFFIELELQPGDIIAMQLPNFALSPLTLLGAWRAGLTVAALPMLWRGHEIARVCAALEPKALIGVSHFAGDTPMESLSAVAASRSQVRFVLGFGPDLPDGAGSLDEVISIPRPLQPVETLMREGPAMITFTARPGMPFVPVERDEEELLAQGAMTVVALDLDRSDVILNPYSLTGPAGLSLGFLPWLISGATLALHHPFDYGVFAEQLIATGTTVTALPSTVLAELSRDGVPQRPQCRLRRVGSVWTGDEPQDKAPLDFDEAVEFFDLYSLGDLAGVVLKREAPDELVLLPLGEIPVDKESEGAVFVETRLASLRDPEGYAEVLVRGPVVPRGQAEGPLVPDDNGFIATGLRGVRVGTTGMALQLKGDPELLRHGGLSIAASEFDELYRSFPAFLDAACLVLTDPPIGDHVVAAVVPRPGEPVTLEALNKFLEERRVASYKFPDKILIVRRIPRDEHGRVLREEILLEV